MKFEREIAAIKSRPYTRELIPEADGTWFARVVEFPGCMTAGATPEEAMRMLDDATTGWLAVMLEDGDEIPGPTKREPARTDPLP